jgi:hypothetical protein
LIIYVLDMKLQVADDIKARSVDALPMGLDLSIRVVVRTVRAMMIRVTV